MPRLQHSLRVTGQLTSRVLRRETAVSLAFGALALSASACGDKQDDRGTTPFPTSIGAPDSTAVPAPAGSRTPSLLARNDGALLLSWTEPLVDSSYAIRLATYRDGRWDSTRTVSSGRPYFVNWADFPSVTQLGNGQLAAHWLEREGSSSYAYGVRVVQSSDDGRSWNAPVTPHTDGLLVEHGFVSLWPQGPNQLGLAWLDGRKSAIPDSAREMTVRTAVVRPDGSLSREAVLDARACDCCQTASAMTSTGRVVVYRDRSDKDIRDIAIVRELVSGWSPPALVHADDWHYEGCPVNGPSVAASGQNVAVAWFTAAHDTSRVLLARSVDGGLTFDPPVRIDDGDPLGRVSVVLDSNGQPIVAWLEQRTPVVSELLLRRVAGTSPGDARRVSRTSGGRQSGFPRLARIGDTLYAAWTTMSPRPQVQLVRLSLSPDAP